MGLGFVLSSLSSMLVTAFFSYVVRLDKEMSLMFACTDAMNDGKGAPFFFDIEQRLRIACA